MFELLKRLIDWPTIKAGIPSQQPSPLAKELIRLLISDRDNWARSSHHLTHNSTGISIWTANEVYGLHLETKDHVEIQLNASDRRAVYDAARWDEFDRDKAKWLLAGHAR